MARAEVRCAGQRHPSVLAGSTLAGSTLAGSALAGSPLAASTLAASLLLPPVLLLGLVAGCTEDLCTDDQGCPAGQRCDTATGECYAPADAGVDAGPDGGDAGTPCTSWLECTDPEAPICDPTEGICRSCAEGAGECATQRPDAPVCAPASAGALAGRCVECLDSATHCDADPAAPICDADTGACRGCAEGAGECAAAWPDAPVCAPASAGALAGQCVECLDSASHCAGADPAAPVCDADSRTCRGCEAHAECAAPLGGGVCDRDSGVCLAEAEIWYVDDDTCPAAGDGSLATPFCALQDAVDAATPGKSAVWVFEGGYDRVEVTNKQVWIVGESPAAIISPVNNNVNALSVSNDNQAHVTEVTVERLAFKNGGSAGKGIHCTWTAGDMPTLTARGCTIENNAGGGVSATSCTVTLDGNTITGNSGSGVSASSSTATLDGNTITGNSGGGINLSESEFTVVNNVIALNGGPSAAIGGVSIYQPGSVAEFAFNTVVENDASSEAGGIYCVQAATIESSLVYDNTDGDLSASCTASYSWTTSDGDPGLAGSGDYHLAPGSPCIDGGNPAATLDHDIDGQSRPQGTAPDIGADEAG